jgi:predicted PurR-regulated permease PerM
VNRDERIERHLAAIRGVLVVFLVILVFFLLQTLSSLLIPLAMAALLAFLAAPITKWLRNNKLPGWLIFPAVAFGSLTLLGLVALVFMQTANEVAAQQDYLLARFENKLISLTEFVNNVTGDFYQISGVLDEGRKLLTTDVISAIAGFLASNFGSFTGSFIIFAFYYIIILAGLQNAPRFLAFVGGPDRSTRLIDSFNKIQKSISGYLVVKIIVSVMTGVATYVACLVFGIKFAFFWSFLTVLLNFIPSIGSTIAVIFPVLMGFIQYDSVGMPLLLAAILVSVQMTIGNLVEPMMMGNSLRLNTLTAIFGLFFWGYLWGIAGMFLSLPLIVVFKLVLERSENLVVFARLMGDPDEE